MTKKETKTRSSTFADLRGILSGKVRSLSDGELHQWIDEARSRALPSARKDRTPDFRHVGQE